MSDYVTVVLFARSGKREVVEIDAALHQFDRHPSVLEPIWIVIRKKILLRILRSAGV